MNILPTNLKRHVLNSKGDADVLLTVWKEEERFPEKTRKRKEGSTKAFSNAHRS